ncbi:DNA-directed RNA polymerase subunit K [Candidatus Woesearchaeota archaeon]|mgnify:CR=1 FL=1|jgi:DNA-directed RNA polymerase subunit K|nr:DNA-directed RNA polymerase subunit K [Candidatus Woesearchaeota archaeon]
MVTENYTKYEKARMIGSRALQLSMGAPFLVKLSEKELEKIRFDPIEIALIEFDEGVLPITVRRPLAGAK